MLALPKLLFRGLMRAWGFFIKTTQHLAGKQSEQCRWIAMKGCCTQQELDEVMSPYCIEKRISLTVPGLSAKGS